LLQCLACLGHGLPRLSIQHRLKGPHRHVLCIQRRRLEMLQQYLWAGEHDCYIDLTSTSKKRRFPPSRGTICLSGIALRYVLVLLGALRLEDAFATPSGLMSRCLDNVSIRMLVTILNVTGRKRQYQWHASLLETLHFIIPEPD